MCRQVPLVALVGTLAAYCCWSQESGFVGTQGPHRPAGSTAIVDNLPRGLTCRRGISQITPNRYGRDSPEYDPAEPAIMLPYGSDKRAEWRPIPQWRGEKTFHPCKKLQDDQYRQWYHFDAEGKTLGHLAKAVAATLEGTDSPLYDPIRDVGAYAIVTNCERIRVSGKKYHYKLYLRNVGNRPGNMKVERFKDLLKRFPERIIMRAVWGMMKKTPANRRIFKERLKLFAGPNHLYYNKDPVEYPMHKIKDCTHTANLRYRDRTMQYLKNQKPRDEVVLQYKQARVDRTRLKQYRTFLSKQLSRLGEEAAKDMDMEEFVAKATENEYDRVWEETEGDEPKKKKENLFYETWLPKQKYSDNRNRRKGVTHIPPVQVWKEPKMEEGK